MRFFFYGTLLDPDVRWLVLPHCFERLALRPAALTGWRRVQARHGCFPVVRRQPGGRVAGLLVEGIDRAGLHRMAHFEGDGYTVGRIAVAAGDRSFESHLFLPERPALCLAAGWSLEAWQRRHKRRFLPRVRRWMGEFGAAGPWSADLSWHARRRLAAIARETKSARAALRLAA
ncbi:MAG: gamma-glutamylcyclotransferase family protein [Tistlia sp.]|uniref:gamma-glutamylcyclotransferase family protein n=1 Tax=Tistlia sp. TaxID=3057121 RepID=UPI0034A12F3D